jgi:hypothetical protein
VVAFLRPRVEDLRAFAAIIDDFGAASGLRTNLSKCSAHLMDRWIDACMDPLYTS